MRDIQAFARQIAKEFKPQRIILFGSHAYGQPSEDSDVDLMVEMSYKGSSVYQALEILNRLDPRFGIDLIVKSPREIKKRLKINDWFLQEIIEKGKLLYEAGNPRVG